MQFRQASAFEMDQIYLMGFDVWSGGQSHAEYLTGCRCSGKYKSGKWYVLNDGDMLLASCLVHSFPNWGERTVRGIGSIATAPEFRRKGYARSLLDWVVDNLVKNDRTELIFLYSDIDTQYYLKSSFRPLPPKYQKAQRSTVMIAMFPKFDYDLVEEYADLIPKYF